MAIKKTHIQFIEQANKIHNYKYSYPDIYLGDNVKINICCPKHGNFKQVPSSHLCGCGCRKCAIEHNSKLFLKSNEDFLNKAILIHNDKYRYLDVYAGAKTKIKIECPVHGIFIQSPDKHLQGNGCPNCAGKIKKTTEQFIKEANFIHNKKYTYPEKYINARTYIKIICPKHGFFKQIPDVHISGHGCPRCSTNVSKSEINWLNYLGIPDNNEHRSVRLKIGKFYIKPDGFDPKTNTIYEFYGDYFHGNPNKYPPDMINHKNKKTMGELYNNTLKRQKLIKEAGYNLIFIWESEWNNK